MFRIKATTMNAFKGTGVALVTPFHEDNRIDIASFQKLIDHVISGGADYLVPLGTTGESATLSATEKAQVLKACVAHTKGRCPIMIGIGGNHTQAVLDTLSSTDFYGVAAILSVSPYYNKPTQAGIIAHFRAIADASPVPVMLYNIPGRTMSNMHASTTLALSHHPNIIGIKEASGNVEQCIHIASAMPKDFLLLSGEDMLTKAIQSIGGSGVISVLANAFPSTFSKMVHGDLQASLQANYSLLKYNDLMYQEGNPVGIKHLLYKMGVIQSDQVRLPLLRASQELGEKISMALES